VISYLTARRKDEEHLKWKQQSTQEWWEQRHDYDLFVSDTVLYEIESGDKTASDLRKAVIEDVPILIITQEVKQLAQVLLDKNAVPEKASQDATHIACASIHKIDFLLTWNQKHIINKQKLIQINNIIYNEGCKIPYICTPKQLLEIRR
jgi:hypothetical protein